MVSAPVRPIGTVIGVASHFATLLEQSLDTLFSSPGSMMLLPAGTCAPRGHGDRRVHGRATFRGRTPLLFRQRSGYPSVIPVIQHGPPGNRRAIPVENDRSVQRS